MKRSVIALVIFGLMMGFTQPVLAYTNNLDPQESYDRLSNDPEAFLLDVRRVDEWDAGHPGFEADNVDYNGAFLAGRVLNIPWQFVGGDLNDKFDLVVTKLFDFNDHLYLICRSGNRSGQASTRLVTDLGFSEENIVNISGGFNSWQSVGLPWNQDSSGVWPAALAAAPLPASLPLLATGLGLLAWIGIRRRSL